MQLGLMSCLHASWVNYSSFYSFFVSLGLCVQDTKVIRKILVNKKLGKVKYARSLEFDAWLEQLHLNLDIYICIAQIHFKFQKNHLFWLIKCSGVNRHKRQPYTNLVEIEDSKAKRRISS
jgi:hypothetical protein